MLCLFVFPLNYRGCFLSNISSPDPPYASLLTFGLSFSFLVCLHFFLPPPKRSITRHKILANLVLSSARCKADVLAKFSPCNFILIDLDK